MDWPARATPPPIAAGEVHLWRIPLNGGVDTAPLYAVLDGAERAQAARARGAGARRTRVIARGALRLLLAGYLRTAPQGIVFACGPRGKPALAHPRTTPPLCFNLSHSGAWALAAFALGRAVGVDIESPRRPVDILALAGRFFAPEETAALEALSGPARDRAFYAAWTRKEAYVKALGCDLTQTLPHFAVRLTPGVPPELVRPAPGDAGCWALHACVPAPGYTAALAVDAAGFGPQWLQRTPPCQFTHELERGGPA